MLKLRANTPQDQGSHDHDQISHDQTSLSVSAPTMGKPGSHDQDCVSASKSEPGSHDQDQVSHDETSSASTASIKKEPGSHDQDQVSRDLEQDQKPGTSSETSSRIDPASVMTLAQQNVLQALEQEGHVSGNIECLNTCSKDSCISGVRATAT